MRSNLFSLGMCSAVAAVAVAGSAVAAIPTGVALFDFTTGVTANSSGSVNGSNPFNRWGTDSAYKATTTSATAFGGAITIANQAFQSGGFPTGDFSVSATTPVNLSGTTAIVFNVTAYSGAATDWNLMLMDSNFNWFDAFLYSTSGTGMKSFDTSGPPTDPGFDWSTVILVELQAKTKGNSGNRAASSFTFDSMVAVGAVPAPGAAALVGMAGLIAARRRKA
jgi:hypothetical protein